MQEARYGVCTRPLRITAAGYRLGAVIGIGTYGEVRYGRHEVTNQRVAIKIIDPSRFGEETTQQLMKEIKILRMIDHPNCVRVVEVRENVSFRGTFCENCACTEFKAGSGTDCANCAHSGSEHSAEDVRRVLFIVQELAAAGELFSLIMHTGPLQEDLARFYFSQLLDGLHYLHKKGISHRDLKPENLVLDAQFNLKIIDFGLAAFTPSSEEGDKANLFHSGVGSQPYSAPEVFYQKELYGGHGYRGPPADLWSAAVILFTALAGRPPFIRPLAKTYGQSMRRCRHFINLLNGTGYVSSMSPAVRSLMDKIFKVEADKRATMEQLRQEEWLQAPMLPAATLSKLMDERVRTMFQAQGKMELIELLTEIQSESDSPMLSDGVLPRGGSRDGHRKVETQYESTQCASPKASPRKASPRRGLPRLCASPRASPIMSPKHSPRVCPVLVLDDASDPFRGADFDLSLLTISDDHPPVTRSVPRFELTHEDHAHVLDKTAAACGAAAASHHAAAVAGGVMPLDVSSGVLGQVHGKSGACMRTHRVRQFTTQRTQQL